MSRDIDAYNDSQLAKHEQRFLEPEPEPKELKETENKNKDETHNGKH